MRYADPRTIPLPFSFHTPVARYVTPDEFASWRQQALDLGFGSVAAGALVRSSYKAPLFLGNQMKVWRYLDTGSLPGSQYGHRSGILGLHANGKAPPTLRLYQWTPPAVSIGYCQTKYTLTWKPAATLVSMLSGGPVADRRCCIRRSDLFSYCWYRRSHTRGSLGGLPPGCRRSAQRFRPVGPGRANGWGYYETSPG